MSLNKLYTSLRQAASYTAMSRVDLEQSVVMGKDDVAELQQALRERETAEFHIREQIATFCAKGN